MAWSARDCFPGWSLAIPGWAGLGWAVPPLAMLRCDVWMCMHVCSLCVGRCVSMCPRVVCVCSGEVCV